MFLFSLYYSEPENRSLKVFVPPHMGELIAAWCEFDGHWYRAIARDQYNNEIHVIYIDFVIIGFTFVRFSILT